MDLLLQYYIQDNQLKSHTTGIVLSPTNMKLLVLTYKTSTRTSNWLEYSFGTISTAPTPSASVISADRRNG